MMDAVWEALQGLRVPIQQGEYDLHHLVAEALTAHGIASVHEAPLGPRCRIDLLCGTVGIEIKRGKPNRTQLLRQLTRYAECEAVSCLIVVAERSVDLPRTLRGKPVRVLCLNRLWGIAL